MSDRGQVWATISPTPAPLCKPICPCARSGAPSGPLVDLAPVPDVMQEDAPGVCVEFDQICSAAVTGRELRSA
jgi:hypothetical protein